MKRIILLIISLSVLLLSLAACKLPTPGGSTPGGGAEEDDAPYTNTVVATGDTTNYSQIYRALKDKGLNIPSYSDGMEVGEREIAIGNTNRKITKTAYAKLLEKLEDNDLLDKWDTVGYIIYAEGGSVAICWYGDYIIERAINDFVEDYINKDNYVFKDGTVSFVADSYISILEAEEALVREAELAKIAEQYSPEVATAIANHLSMFDDRYYLWLANLYDCGEYDADGNPLGGGFYFSNSARDNLGFLPDIESTRQVLSFLESSGMIKEYKDLKEAIPEKMQKEMVAFAKSLQSPVDGYFYHPQWGTDIKTSRLSRDLGNCTGIITMFGYKPYWNAPNGTKGELGAAPGKQLTASFGCESTVIAVSRVVSLAEGDRASWPAHLESLEAFRNYLLDFGPDMETKSYSIGNTVTSQTAQILNREAEAIEFGDLDCDGNVIVDADDDGIAENGFIMEFKKFFDSYAYPNGTWEDHTESITYTQVNGLMKISSAYNGLHVPLPYPEASLKAAIAAAKLPGADCTGDSPDQSVDVYNPFVSMNAVFSNVKNYCGDPALSAELRESIKGDVLELIEVTTSKVARFLRNDGSASYTIKGNCPTSQGAPVAVVGAVEGDVNGGNIAFTGVFTHMSNALEIDVRIFFASDYAKFLHEIEGLSAVTKAPIPEREPEEITFEDEDIGENDIADVIDQMNGGYIEITSDPSSDGEHGNVLKFVDEESGDIANGVNIKMYGKEDTASCFVCRFDAYIEGYGKNATIMRWTLTDAYRIQLKESDGRLILVEDTSGGISRELGITLELSRWYNIRIEYYVGDAEGVKIKIFIDDELRAISTNFYGKKKDGTAEPKNSTTGLNIYSFYPVVQTAYFDNFYLARTTDTYVDEPIINHDRIKDFEDAAVGGALPDGVISNKDGTAEPEIISDGETKLLYMPSGSSSVNISAVTSAVHVNTFLFDMDVLLDTKTEGSLLTLYIGGGTDKSTVAAYEVRAERSGKAIYATVYALTKDGTGEDAVGTAETGESFNLRIEYYIHRFDTDVTSIVYINGDEVGRLSGYYSINNLSKSYSALTVKVGAASTSVTLDNVIAENHYIDYKDENGTIVPDPTTPFPSGGKGSSTPIGEGHTGVFDFEGGELGVPAIGGLTTKPNSEEVGNSMEISKDPGDDENHALFIKGEKSTNGTNNYLTFAGAPELMKDSCYVFEARFLISDYTGTPVLQLLFADSNGTDGIMGLNFRPTAGTVHTRVSSGYSNAMGIPQQDKEVASGITADSDGWITLRIEYYSEENIAKCYVNGEFTGEDETFFNASSESYNFTIVKLALTSTTDIDFYIDDVTVTTLDKEYTEN